MALPAGVVFDLDLSTLPGGHGDSISRIEADGTEFSASMTIRDDAGPIRGVETSGVDSSSSTYATTESTIMCAFIPGVPGPPFARSVASCRMSSAEGDMWHLGTPPLFEVPQGELMILAMSYSSAGITGYTNGRLVASVPADSGMGQASSAYLPAGVIFRVLWWDEILSPEAVQAAAAELFDVYAVVNTLSWEAPEFDGGLPVTGYAVKTFAGGNFEEREVKVPSVEVKGSGVAHVAAVNAAGRSTPVEITF